MISHLKFFEGLRFATLCLMLLASAQVAAIEDPRGLVMRTSQELVDLLVKNRQEIKKTPDIAFKLADQTVIPNVDFVKISQWVLGKYWREANSEQKKHFVAAFQRFIVNTYVTAMVTYTDEIIRESKNVSYPDNKTKIDNDKALVASVIQLNSGQRVEVGYRLYLSNNGWKIYDVVIEGISLAIKIGRASCRERVLRRV